jgi:glycosyltransferase involved in cell wall biosynthesis
MTRETEQIPERAGALRVAFFSDSLPERNGTGAYYHDLIASLGPRVAGCEIFQPVRERLFNAATIPLPGDTTQEFAVPAARRIRDALNELRPHGVVSVTPGPFGQLGKRMARRHGAAFITAYHTDFAALASLYWGPVRRRLSNRLIARMNRRLCRSSATVLVNNSDLVADVQRLGAPRVDVVGTPVEQAFLETAPPPAPRRPEPVVFAGRLAAEKNIDTILDAARRRPGQHFVIAGDGPQRERVIRASQALNNLDYRGWLDRRALRDLMDQAGLVVLPSYVETFGSVVLEAMVRRRPVLVTAEAGIHDWPQVADSLYKIEPNETLADALERLDPITPEQWAQRAERGRQGAVAIHEGTIAQWLTLLATHARALA